MKHIGNLSPAPGSRHKKKRVGRGAGSGHGGENNTKKGTDSRKNNISKPKIDTQK
jgi:large subunit ribosomal protein L15